MSGSSSGHLDPPAPDDGVRKLYDEDVADHGYVMNLTRAWAHQPATHDGLFALMRQATSPLALDARRRALLVTACASAFGDSYCSLAWGARLAAASDPGTAAGVIRGDDQGLSPAERAMVGWARAVASNPNATTAADVQALRDAGFADQEIFAITVFVALRLAFATVNEAVGVRPDAQLRTSVPAAVRDAVTFGRPVDGVL
jgi:uncharacterized peroxidase-related enzyme